MKMLSRVLRVIGPVALASVLVAGCSSNAPQTLIGVRGVSLSLAFKDETLTPPVPTRVIVTLLPATPEAIRAVVPEYSPPAAPRLTTPPPIAVPELCPKAPEGAAAELPADVAITKPPREGVYYKLNIGTLRIEGGVIPLSLPYPPFTKVTISHVARSTKSDPYNGTTGVVNFESEEQIIPTLSVHSYYTYDNAQLNLVREEVVNDGKITPFQPTPALEVLAFTGPGNTWNAAAIDTASSEAATVRGSIDANRELVDVCGTVVDTLKVSTEEQRLSLSTGSSEGSDNGKPILQNYALQYGGLVVRREEHSTRIINVNGARVILYTDVVGKLLSIAPVPGLAQ